MPDILSNFLDKEFVIQILNIKLRLEKGNRFNIGDTEMYITLHKQYGDSIKLKITLTRIFFGTKICCIFKAKGDYI